MASDPLTTARSEVQYLHVSFISVPGFQISVCFTLRPTVVELHAIWRQVHRMTLNDIERLKVEDTLYVRVLLASTSPKLHSVLLYGQHFTQEGFRKLQMHGMISE